VCEWGVRRKWWIGQERGLNTLQYITKWQWEEGVVVGWVYACSAQLTVHFVSVEEWAYDPAVLQRVSSHATTEEPLPLALAEQLQRGRFAVGSHTPVSSAYVTALSWADLIVHSSPAPPYTSPLDGKAYSSVASLTRALFAYIGLPPASPSAEYFPHMYHPVQGYDVVSEAGREEGGVIKYVLLQ
jgi:hypothetical protein